MPKFKAQVSTVEGTQTIVAEGESPEVVSDDLFAQGHIVLAIQQVRTLNPSLNILSPKPPSVSELAVFTRQFSALIRAGLNITVTLKTLEEQTTQPVLKKAANSIRNHIRRGGTLTKGLAQFPKLFDPLYISLVQAGEQAGTLEETLIRLANLVETRASLRRMIRSAMVQPVVIMIITAGVAYFLLTGIVPKFAGLLSGIGGHLPTLTRVVLAFSGFLQHDILIVILAVVTTVVAYRMYVSKPRGAFQRDRWVLRLPLFGPLVQKTQIAQFTRTLGMLLRSGITLSEALPLADQSLTSLPLKQVARNALQQIRIGNPIYLSFAGAKQYYPPLVASMIRIGEDTGALDKMLDQLAVYYEEEATSTIASLSSAIEPLMTVFIGAIIGTLVLSIFLPYFSILQNLSH